MPVVKRQTMPGVSPGSCWLFYRIFIKYEFPVNGCVFCFFFTLASMICSSLMTQMIHILFWITSSGSLYAHTGWERDPRVTQTRLS